MNRPQQTELARPMGAYVKDNPTGYGSYVAHPIYKQRLLQLDIPWDFELVEILRGEAAGKKGETPLVNVIVGAVYRLTVTVDGKQRVIEEVGDCELPSNWPHDGARLKDAASDAFKRCCAHLGLGLHLYVKDQADYFLFKRLDEAES